MSLARNHEGKRTIIDLGIYLDIDWHRTAKKRRRVDTLLSGGGISAVCLNCEIVMTKNHQH